MNQDVRVPGVAEPVSFSASCTGKRASCPWVRVSGDFCSRDYCSRSGSLLSIRRSHQQTLWAVAFSDPWVCSRARKASPTTWVVPTIARTQGRPRPLPTARTMLISTAIQTSSPDHVVEEQMLPGDTKWSMMRPIMRPLSTRSPLFKNGYSQHSHVAVSMPRSQSAP
jgi:hypothetical protein